MHWAVWHVIESPNWATNQSRIRFCYEDWFYFQNPNGTRVSRAVVVILGETGVRIMTAFPRKKAYCKGPRIN